MADVNLSIGITGDSSGAVDAAKQAKGALDSLNSVQVGKNVQDGVRKTANTVKELGATSLSAVNGILPLDSGLKGVAGTALTGFDAIGKLAASGFSPLGLAITGVSLLLPLIIEQFRTMEKTAADLYNEIGGIEKIQAGQKSFSDFLDTLKDFTPQTEKTKKAIQDFQNSIAATETETKRLNSEIANSFRKNPFEIIGQGSKELKKSFSDAGEKSKKASELAKNAVLEEEKIFRQYFQIYFTGRNQQQASEKARAEAQKEINKRIQEATNEQIEANKKAFDSALKNADVFKKNIQTILKTGITPEEAIERLTGLNRQFMNAEFKNFLSIVKGFQAEQAQEIIKNESEIQKKQQENRGREKQAIINYYQNLKTLDDIRNQNIVNREQFERAVIADSEQRIRELGLRGVEAQIARAQAEKTINENRVREAQLQFGALADAERQFAESIQKAYNAVEPPDFDVFGDFAKSIEEANIKMVASQAIAGSLSNDLFALGASLRENGEAFSSLGNIAMAAANAMVKAVTMEVSKTAIAKGSMAILEGGIKVAKSIYPPNPAEASAGLGMIAKGSALVALGGGAAVAGGALAGGGGGSRAGGGERVERPAPVAGSVVNQTIELSGTYDPGSIELVRRFQEQTAEDMRRRGI